MNGMYCFGSPVYRSGFRVYRFSFRLYRFSSSWTVLVSDYTVLVPDVVEPFRYIKILNFLFKNTNIKKQHIKNKYFDFCVWFLKILYIFLIFFKMSDENICCFRLTIKLMKIETDNEIWFFKNKRLGSNLSWKKKEKMTMTMLTMLVKMKSQEMIRWSNFNLT